MITQIIKLLQADDYFAVSKEAEIAKGKYEIPDTRDKLKTKIKRQWRARHMK